MSPARVPAELPEKMQPAKWSVPESIEIPPPFKQSNIKHAIRSTIAKEEEEQKE
jgi:hypothetical protein